MRDFGDQRARLIVHTGSSTPRSRRRVSSASVSAGDSLAVLRAVAMLQCVDDRMSPSAFHRKVRRSCGPVPAFAARLRGSAAGPAARRGRSAGIRARGAERFGPDFSSCSVVLFADGTRRAAASRARRRRNKGRPVAPTRYRTWRSARRSPDPVRRASGHARSPRPARISHLRAPA